MFYLLSFLDIKISEWLGGPLCLGQYDVDISTLNKKGAPVASTAVILQSKR